MAHPFNLGLAFRAVADAHPDRPALRYPDRMVSYRELDRLSNRIARLFLEQHLRPGDVVAIFHDKCAEAFAAVLACLKIGLIYVNLDPDSPWERLRKILETCAPKVFVNGFADFGHGPVLEQQGALCIDLQAGTTRSKLAGHDDASVASLSTATGGHPAYIMFTSGSTGIPKGAVMSHGNVLNFIRWAQDRFQVTPEDIFSNVNPMYFDNSVFDFYVSLFSGASLVPLTATQVRDPRQLLDVVNSLRCTIWFSVPSLLVYLLATRALDAHDLPAVRKVIVGGEGFPKPKLKKLYDLFGGRAELENVYGPTECTCICSAHTIQPADFADMKSLAPLGFLAPDFSYEILDPADSADEGELFLCGPNVGLGYYNDPDRTTASFIQNPRHSRFRDIGYRTGDLVRRDPDGRLHFIGRTDFQIKHMGYRIELEEVESALAGLPQVGECAVIYRKLGDSLGELIGFVVAAEPTNPDELIRGVARFLPTYMIPRRVTILQNLPRNANGKIDRIALQGVAALPT